MRTRVAVLLWLLILSPLAPAAALTRPVSVAVSAGGTTLGRLTGQFEGRVTYFPLDDVARLVGGSTRRAVAGDRATLRVRQRTLEVRRDAARVYAGGRPLTLSAPVRVHGGVWLVPGDLLVRALPVLVGTGVQIVPAAQPVVASAPVRPPVTVAALRSPTRDEPLAPTPAPAGPPPAPVAPEAPPPAVPPPSSVAPPAPPSAGRAGTSGLELRFRSYPTYTRVVLEGDAPLEPRLVDGRDGLAVTLAGSSYRGPAAVRAVRDGLVGHIELAESRGAATVRVTFERVPATRKVYRLTDPPRLVLDFYRKGPAPASTGPDPVRTIVIDPGHGGHDPGAVGPGGLQEKELTLDVARRVAALVQEDLGVKVLLTRSRDQFVALRERTALANREKADLFLSIHVNSAPASAASGAESYFLSSEATDNAARAAAAAENKVITLEAGARGGARDVLRSILWDLAQSDFQQESSRLAEVLQGSLDRALRLPSRGVKQAPFYVLGGAAMPAVLTEIGFLTNSQEEQRLRDDGYRDRIARALAAGLAAYKQNYDRRVGAVARR